MKAKVPRMAPAPKVTFKEVDVKSQEAGKAQLESLHVAASAKEATAKKGKVWLKWTENRVWIVFPNKGSNFLSTLTSATAVLTRDQVAQALKMERQLNILPGLHDYPEGLWDRVKDHEDVVMALNDGRLILFSMADAGAKGPEAEQTMMRKLPETLEDVPTATARELAEGCQDEEVLERWLQGEQRGKARGTVLVELEAQLQLVRDTEEAVEAAAG